MPLPRPTRLWSSSIHCIRPETIAPEQPSGRTCATCSSRFAIIMGHPRCRAKCSCHSISALSAPRTTSFPSIDDVQRPAILLPSATHKSAPAYLLFCISDHARALSAVALFPLPCSTFSQTFDCNQRLGFPRHSFNFSTGYAL